MWSTLSLTVAFGAPRHRLVEGRTSPAALGISQSAPTLARLSSDPQELQCAPALRQRVSFATKRHPWRLRSRVYRLCRRSLVGGGDRGPPVKAGRITGLLRLKRSRPWRSHEAKAVVGLGARLACLAGRKKAAGCVRRTPAAGELRAAWAGCRDTYLSWLHYSVRARVGTADAEGTDGRPTGRRRRRLAYAISLFLGRGLTQRRDRGRGAMGGWVSEGRCVGGERSG
jgi:hypothetical protein